jgi:uncharacterized BrkB/YihY/UPF0761 family membrane protein
MTQTKKILSISLLIIIILMFCGFDIGFDNSGVLRDKTQLGTEDPATVAYSLINAALVFLGIITVVLIIAAGFMWMFAAGEEEKIKKAQDILKGAILGLVIIMASYGIAQYVFDKLMGITIEGTVTAGEATIETE